MKTTKILAYLVVVCMLATCMFCIAGTDDTNADVIRSEDTVVIDVDKSFQENQSQLAKLGITEQKYWYYDNSNGCYKLILNNVHFSTTSLDGIIFVSYSADANPKVIIDLIGNNSIVSGSVKTQEWQQLDSSCAIVCVHSIDGTFMNDFGIIIEGDGSLEVTNANLSHSIIETCGIYVYGNLTICNGAYVIAAGSGFEHSCKAEHAVKKLEISSCGVCVVDKLTVSNARLLGMGGEVYTVFEKQEQADKQIYCYSEGITAAKYVIDENSYVHGVGGKIDWNTMKQEYIEAGAFTIHALSKGVATLTDYTGAKTYEHSVEIHNSKVVGLSNTAKGLVSAMSHGISFESESTIDIVGSMIIGTSDDVFVVKKGFNGDGTIGINLVGNTIIKSSYVQGTSGNHANASFVEVAAGIYCDGNFSVDDSVIIGEERVPVGDATLEKSDGIYVHGIFNIKDSEVYAKGFGQAIEAFGGLTPSLGNRGCYSLDNDGHRTAIDVSELTSENNKAVELLYAYDVIISTVDGDLIGFQRSTSEYYTVGPYMGFVPNGMKFAGYEDTDGEAIKIGDVYVIDDPLILVATFDVADEPDSGNAWVAWALVIGALIIIALLVGGLCVSRKLKG